MKFYKKERKERQEVKEEKETKSRRLCLIWTDLSRNLGVSPGMLKKGGGYRDWGVEAPATEASSHRGRPPIHSAFHFSTAHLRFMNGLCCKGSLVSQLFVTQHVFNPQKAYPHNNVINATPYYSRLHQNHLTSTTGQNSTRLP